MGFVLKDLLSTPFVYWSSVEHIAIKQSSNESQPSFAYAATNKKDRTLAGRQNKFYTRVHDHRTLIMKSLDLFMTVT